MELFSRQHFNFRSNFRVERPIFNVMKLSDDCTFWEVEIIEPGDNSTLLVLALENQLFNTSRTSIHFLQESVRFHFQDLGRQCIVFSGISENHGRNCLILRGLARSYKKCLNLGRSWKKCLILGVTWKKMSDPGRNLEESA